MERRVFVPAGALLLCLLAHPGLRAQTVTIDEGTYRITVGGTEVGSEVFAIRRSGNGVEPLIEASGRVTLDAGPAVTSVLRFAGPALRPAEYVLQVAGSPGETHSGRVTGRRVSARIVSSAGENMREYLVGAGAVVIDDGVAHQHYFLARRVRDGETRIPVIVPREGRQSWITVEVAGEESITVGGQRTTARRLELRPEQGDPRTLWTDAADRVLRLEIPARQFIAERTTLPAS